MTQREINSSIFKLNHRKRFHFAAGIIVKKLEKDIKGKIYINYDETENALLIRIENKYFMERFRIPNANESISKLTHVSDIANGVVEAYKQAVIKRFIKNVTKS